jgi:hypothetical protein
VEEATVRGAMMVMMNNLVAVNKKNKNPAERKAAFSLRFLGF